MVSRPPGFQVRGFLLGGPGLLGSVPGLVSRLRVSDSRLPGLLVSRVSGFPPRSLGFFSIFPVSSRVLGSSFPVSCPGFSLTLERLRRFPDAVRKSVLSSSSDKAKSASGAPGTPSSPRKEAVLRARIHSNSEYVNNPALRRQGNMTQRPTLFPDQKAFFTSGAGVCSSCSLSAPDAPGPVPAN